MGFEVPEPHRVVDLTMADGAIVRLRQHGDPAAPRIVMSHGNGMAMDCYYPFWGPLTDDYEIILYDFRNHGWNPVHGLIHHNFPIFVWDNEIICDAIRREFGDKPMLGAFHSMSAITAILQTLRFGPRWDALALFDPPLTPPNGHPLEQTALEDHLLMSARAQRRPERYDSYDDFVRVLKRVPQFSRLVPGAHELLAQATLRDDPENGGVMLRCPRECEAQVFRSNTDSTIAARMPEFPVPLIFICGDPEAANAAIPSFSSLALAEDWGVESAVVPETTHFLQTEAPAETAEAMLAFYRRHGFLD